MGSAWPKTKLLFDHIDEFDLFFTFFTIELSARLQEGQLRFPTTQRERERESHSCHWKTSAAFAALQIDYRQADIIPMPYVKRPHQVHSIVIVEGALVMCTC